MIHDRAVCFGCNKTIEHDPIFASPCDDGKRGSRHERCASAVWHGVCLMSHREHVGKAKSAMRRFLRDHGIPIPPHLAEE